MRLTLFLLVSAQQVANMWYVLFSTRDKYRYVIVSRFSPSELISVTTMCYTDTTNSSHVRYHGNTVVCHRNERTWWVAEAINNPVVVV